MEPVTLSLCMIAKNESGNIGRCLQSARDFVDEIIVVDTGSSDDTVDIARAMGATVIETEWQDDFSLARNASLDRATGDWILFLDCDEELATGSGPDLRALIRNSRHEAYFTQVSNLTETGSKLLAPSVRLFRNRKEFRFQGRIHEQIATSIIANQGQQSIGQCSISIIHHGYNGQQSNIQAKIRRNLKLLNNTADQEKDGFFYYNLGVEHLRLRELEQALDCFLEASKLTAANLGYAPILALRSAATLMDLFRFRDAVRHLKYYQSIYRDFNDLVLLEMLCYLHCGWYSQASACLERYFAMPPVPAWYPTETNYCGASAEEYRDWLQERPIPKDYPGISACIIGRDEADRIRHCIHSLNEIAREVIYVDTGSTDNTLAIAFQHGAKIFPVKWPGNFSEARNYALDQASEDWILVLDADEMLPEESKKPIVEALKQAPAEAGGYNLKICTYLDGSISPANCEITGSCRLFRRAPRVPSGGSAGQGGPGPVARYRGAANEEVARSLQELGLTITPAEIIINHLHYQAEPKNIAGKRQRKIEAINQGLREDQFACNYLLGRELFYDEDFAAASDRFAACRKLNDLSDRPDFFYYYALSLINIRDYNCAVGILEQAAKLFPDYTDLTYLLAIAHSALGNTDAAETLLRRCLELGDTPWQKYLASPGTGSFKAMHSLGTVLAQRGLFSEAASLLFQATALPGGFEQAIEGIVVLSDQLAVPLEQILEEKGLLNPVSISAAAKTCAKMLRYQDSLRYLALACDQIVQEPAPRNFTSIIQAIDLLIKAFCRGNQAAS